ncbi:hypothetical protein GCM10022243_59970 [Saccharothrix violaceirubra]|uniref:Uncharacterized protein n=1 Tax=Saccharothrix violaceirubra TaxID=413306 RepID=A0A7W7T7G1_9PSEU|nr:hypothetical protein [Saccharothrix violaceirubra]MBB4967973.1 hypothetical protein [Saccharothrix violaceirubra]
MSDPWGDSVRELLYTDFDGQSVDDPDEVINAAFDDGRYVARVAPLTDLLAAPEASAYDRFLACCALTTWGEPAGYQAVVDAAASPGEVVWRDELIDRKYSVDETFAHLAHAVGASEDFAVAKGTEPARLTALRALLRVSDTEYFDWRLAHALDARVLPFVADDVASAVRQGIHTLTEGPRPSFDLAAQSADLAAAVTPYDERLAVALGGDLMRVDTSPSVLLRLVAIVARGTGPVSLRYADYLASVANDEVRCALSDALARRARESSTQAP